MKTVLAALLACSFLAATPVLAADKAESGDKAASKDKKEKKSDKKAEKVREDVEEGRALRLESNGPETSADREQQQQTGVKSDAR